MKITVQINGINTEIELTTEQVASIEAQSKPKKFEFKYPDGKTFLLNYTYISGNCHGSTPGFLEHGRYRLTREAADMSLARNKRANRLEALAEQLGGLKEWVFGEDNYHTFLHQGSYKYGYSSTTFISEVVYMTKECAIEICRILNEGECEL